MLHLAAILLVIGIAKRQPAAPGDDTQAVDMIFDSPILQSAQANPTIQPAEIPAPDDAPLGTPTPTPWTVPQPDRPPPPPALAALPRLAFAPPTEPPSAATASPEPAITAAPTQSAVALPEIRLQPPEDTGDQPSMSLDLPPIMPQLLPTLPSAPLPRAPPRPPAARAVPRQAFGTLSSPMDLSFAPSAPRPAARGAIASRAFDLSPPPERNGPSRSDAYAEIRAANASEDWNRGLHEYWLRHRFYPPQAVENREQGTVTIQLTVERSGRVDDVQVLSRSGSPWLDMAAVGTFRNAQLPPFTNEMRQQRMTFPIPITYYLIRR